MKTTDQKSITMENEQKTEEENNQPEPTPGIRHFNEATQSTLCALAIQISAEDYINDQIHETIGGFHGSVK